MRPENQKLSVVEKAGYSLGDCAANFVFQTQLIFLMNFYTDVFGITAAVAGTMFLVSRLWDAFNDPVMGALADRTNTRWGKFRPWVLWTAVPFAIAFVLAYTTPDLSTTGKIIWAYVTYNLLMMVYTANNIPYSALTGVLTADSIERTSLASWRFLFAMSAAFIVQTFTLDLVNYFGQGDRATGYQMTMALWAVLAVICFVITFSTTKERVHPNPRQRTSLVQDLRDLVGNGPWLALFFLTIFIFINLSLRGGTTLYYFQYFVQREELFGRFNGIGLLATMVGILLSKPLTIRFGKRNTFRVCLFLTALFTALFFFVPAEAVGTIFALQILLQFSYGPTIPLLWAMMADVADYSEWKNNRRATAMAFAVIVFGLKLGLSLGGAAQGWLLKWYGYEPNVEQTQRALDGIVMMMSVFPALAFFIGVGVLGFYKIDKHLEHEIQETLTERRKQFHYPDATSN
jgi:glycoside/pentoside/hexuronide:cation symporter, GPH family